MSECPKCGSMKTKLIQSSYPKVYECRNCKHVFVKPPKTFIDE